MNLLFPQETILPYGFSYYPDFLDMEEEARLVEVISQLELHPLIFQGFEAKRKVESYGYDYNFDTRAISPGKPVPQGLLSLIEKAAAWVAVPPSAFGEVLVTEYPPGSVINWHRDAPPFDFIVGISLLTDCVFKLRPYNKTRQSKKSTITTDVKRRSLYIIKDEARAEWEHSISPVKETRYSITLRTLRQQ